MVPHDGIEQLTTATTQMALDDHNVDNISKDQTSQGITLPTTSPSRGSESVMPASENATDQSPSSSVEASSRQSPDSSTNNSPSDMASQQDKPFTFPPSLSHYNVPAQDWLDAHTDTVALVTGILVFTRNSTNEDRLLLVQRSLSDSFPGCWEVPGGSVDMTGETILEAAARELKEETGLTISTFVRELESVRFRTKRTGWWEKFSFEAEVAEAGAHEGEDARANAMMRVGAKVVLDEKEHQAWLWASEEDVLQERSEGIRLNFATPKQRLIILDGFAARKAPLSGLHTSPDDTGHRRGGTSFAAAAADNATTVN